MWPAVSISMQYGIAVWLARVLDKCPAFLRASGQNDEFNELVIERERERGRVRKTGD